MDLGLKDFANTSDGIKFKSNRYTRNYERDLAKAQKHFSRKQKGDRDENAAKNILNEGLKTIVVGLSDNTVKLK